MRQLAEKIYNRAQGITINLKKVYDSVLHDGSHIICTRLLHFVGTDPSLLIYIYIYIIGVVIMDIVVSGT